MRRAFLLLVAGFCILYGSDVYQLLHQRSKISCYETGKLSNIAKKVTAIRLDKAEDETIENARNIKRNGNDLYLISNACLFRYDSGGKFIKRITSPEKIRVAEYLIDDLNNQLVVLGNEDDIHYYSFEGALLKTTKYTTQNTWEKVQSIAFHQGSIWIVKEAVKNNGEDIQKLLVEYDIHFSEKYTYELDICATGVNQGLAAFTNPVFQVAPDTGEIYIHANFNQPDHLLKDTLAIRHKRKFEMITGKSTKVPVYPLTVGNRYYISCDNDRNETGNYLFCFDEKSKKVWHLRNGLKDNYYRMGQVKALHAMDLTGEFYYFCKSGKDLSNKFKSTIKNEETVVFIVQLKA